MNTSMTQLNYIDNYMPVSLNDLIFNYWRNSPVRVQSANKY